jgi:anti-sigma-K factor RskA
MIDEPKEELAALYALGLLEGQELVRFQTELASEPALRQLVDEFAGTASQLAHTAPPAEPPAALKTRLLDRISANGGPAAKPPASLLTFWLPLAAAAGFALVAVWFAQLHLVSRSENSLLHEQLALADATLRSARNQLEAERLLANRQLNDATQAIASLDRQLREQGDLARFKIATLASLLGNSPQALAVAVWDPNAQEGILSVEKLPALAADKDYQLWVIDPQYPIPVDGGVFTVDPQTGVARYQFKAGKPVRTVAKFAVSLERKGGVPKAEGPMVLISQ